MHPARHLAALAVLVLFLAGVARAQTAPEGCDFCHAKKSDRAVTELFVVTGSRPYDGVYCDECSHKKLKCTKCGRFAFKTDHTERFPVSKTSTRKIPISWGAVADAANLRCAMCVATAAASVPDAPRLPTPAKIDLGPKVDAPAPAKPDPAKPVAKPEPAKPLETKPDAPKPQPAKPIEAKPAEPAKPATPEPAKPDPAAAKPTEPAQPTTPPIIETPDESDSLLPPDIPITYVAIGGIGALAIVVGGIGVLAKSRRPAETTTTWRRDGPAPRSPAGRIEMPRSGSREVARSIVDKVVSAAPKSASAPGQAAPRRPVLDENTPIEPTPPGARPYIWSSAMVALLRLPKACACCLGPASHILYETHASRTEIDWAAMMRNHLRRQLSYIWYRHSREEQVHTFERTVRFPLCDRCKGHEDVQQIASLIGLAAGIVSAIAFLKLFPTVIIWATLLVALLTATVAGLGTIAMLGDRRGPRCITGRPVKVYWTSDDRLEFTFANHNWGERLAELNAPRPADDPPPAPTGLVAVEDADPTPVVERKLGGAVTMTVPSADPPPLERPRSGSTKISVAPRAAPKLANLEGAHALAIHPTGEASLDAMQKYADALGLGLYDARQHLESVLPRVLRVGPKPELDALVERLREGGVVARTISAPSVLGELVPHRVKRLLGVQPLVVEGADGNSASDPVVQWTLEGGPRLLVIGRWMLTHMASGDLVEAVRFCHVYIGDDERPYELVEPQILDYTGLGDRRGPSARANYKAVIDAIAAGAPGSKIDESLFTNAARLPKSVEVVGWGGGESTLRPADAVSRLLAIAWRAERQGLPGSGG